MKDRKEKAKLTILCVSIAGSRTYKRACRHAPFQLQRVCCRRTGWGSPRPGNSQVPSSSMLVPSNYLPCLGEKIKHLGWHCSRLHCLVCQSELHWKIRYFCAVFSDINVKDLHIFGMCYVWGIVCDDCLWPVRFRAENLLCKDLEMLLQAFCTYCFTGILGREDVFYFNNSKN